MRYQLDLTLRQAEGANGVGVARRWPQPFIFKPESRAAAGVGTSRNGTHRKRRVCPGLPIYLVADDANVIRVTGPVQTNRTGCDG